VRILLINDRGTRWAGAENQILGIRDELRRRGHDARLFSSDVINLGLKCESDYTCLGTDARVRNLLQVANPWAYFELRRILREFQPEVVHVRTFLAQLSPSLLPLLRRVPAIYHFVVYRAVCPMGTKVLPNGLLCSHTAGLACLQEHCLPFRSWLPHMMQMALWCRWQDAFDLVIAPSRAALQYYPPSDPARLQVLWNGIPICPQRPPLPDTPVVAYAGRLGREKGVDVLIRAFSSLLAEIPNARLLIAGEGEERGRLKALGQQLHGFPHIQFLGHLSPDELERALRVAWVTVLPSRCVETFGVVVAESMMRGTAVISTTITGCAEVIQEGRTGLLVPPNDPKALMAALQCLLSDKKRAEALGAAAREFALEFLTVEKCVDTLEATYSRLIASYAARPT